MGYSQEELKEKISEGREFYIDTYMTNDNKVVEVVENTEKVSNLFNKVPQSEYEEFDEDSWFIKAKSSENYYLVHVLPNATDDDRAVLRIYVSSSDYEPHGGHNEAYPAAFNFID